MASPHDHQSDTEAAEPQSSNNHSPSPTSEPDGDEDLPSSPPSPPPRSRRSQRLKKKYAIQDQPFYGIAAQFPPLGSDGSDDEILSKATSQAPNTLAKSSNDTDPTAQENSQSSTDAATSGTLDSDEILNPKTKTKSVSTTQTTPMSTSARFSSRKIMISSEPDDNDLPEQHGQVSKKGSTTSKPPPSSSSLSELDSDDVPLPPPSRLRNRRTAASTAPKVQKKQQQLDTFAVETDGQSRKLAAFKKMLDNVVVVNARNVDRTQGVISTPQSLDQYLDGPVYGGRNCVVVNSKYMRTSKTSKGWWYHIESTPPVPTFDRAGLKIIFQDFRYSKSDAEKVVVEVCKILNRIPINLHGGYKIDDRLRDAIINVATEKALPGHTSLRGRIMWRTGKKVYATTINYFEPGTLTPAKLWVEIHPNRIAKARIPDVPASIHFDRQQKGVRAEFPNPKDSSEKKKHEKAIAFLKFLAWKLDGLIVTKDSLQNLRRGYEKTFGATTRILDTQMFAFYGGQQMFSIRKDESAILTRFTPTRYINKDIKGTLPVIVLRSTDTTKINAVANAIYDRWMQSGDLKQCWRAGFARADMFDIKDLDREVDDLECTCTDYISTYTAHLCSSCATPTLCCELERFEDEQRLCQKCVQKIEDQERKDKLPNLSPSESWQRRRLYMSIRNDARAYTAISSQERSDLYYETWESLKNMVHDKAKFLWNDEYHPAVRPNERHVRSTGPRRNPFQTSTEAPFPFSAWRQRTVLHAPDNVTATAFYLNMMKATFIPAVLSYIAEWVNSDRGEAALNTLLQRMDVVHEIGVKAPYARATRMRRPFNQRNLDNHRNEWRTAIIYPSNSNPWASKKFSWVFLGHSDAAGPNTTWEPPECDRIMKVVSEIEAHFGTIMLRRNDCPYPFHPSKVPDDWCWRTCWAMLAGRLSRMENWCNSKWETIDNIETLYLECVWQYLDPAYQDLFHLPLVVFSRHPLRFAVAKVVHGQQMRTGWTRTEPESIEDRDDALNNISIETCTVNNAKLTFPNETYPSIVEDLKRVMIPAKWHTRSSDEGTHLATAINDSDSEDFDDVSDYEASTGEDLFDDEDDEQGDDDQDEGDSEDGDDDDDGEGEGDGDEESATGASRKTKTPSFTKSKQDSSRSKALSTSQGMQSGTVSSTQPGDDSDGGQRDLQELADMGEVVNDRELDDHYEDLRSHVLPTVDPSQSLNRASDQFQALLIDAMRTTLQDRINKDKSVKIRVYCRAILERYLS